MCALASHKYARGEFVQARASYEYVHGEFRACMCVSDFMCVVVHFICICLSTDFDELTP